MADGETERQSAAYAQSAFSQGALTDDAFLDGRVRLLQPKQGYRAATDPVLLAAAAAAKPGDTVLDLGSGAGAAAFCLAARVSGLSMVGLELQPAYADLSRQNAARNGAPQRFTWRSFMGDATAPPPDLRAMNFDWVITNPPFFEADSGLASPTPSRDAAHREAVGLDVWLDCALRRLRPKGTLVVIHRAERLPEMLRVLEGRAGAITVCPLWPRVGAPAKRVILRAVKEARTPFRLAAGLTLHLPKGDAFTPVAQAILRDGAPLDF
ncbi:MAG: methyltransferase [Rhodobacteraceae bacterium]|nr:methyltransferase [Paracoccaceae bacterium]